MEKKDNLVEFGQIMSDLFNGQKKILGKVEKLILAKYGEGNNVGVRNSLEDGRNYLRLNYPKDRWIASVNVVAVRVITSVLWTVNDDYVEIDGDSHNGTATEVWNSTDIVLYYFNGHEVIEVFDIDSIDEVPEGYYCILKEDEPNLEKHFDKKNRDYTFNISVTVTGTYTVVAKNESEALDALHLELPEPTNKNEAFETMNRLKQANFSGYTAKIM